MLIKDIRHIDLTQFDNAQQLEDFVAALRQRSFPLKLGFIGTSAQAHDQLVRSKEYGLVDMEISLIHEHSQLLFSFLDLKAGINVIDIGTGNGLKAANVLSILGYSDTLQIGKYVGLDYSQQLLNIAEQNLKRELPGMALETHFADFEDAGFKAVADGCIPNNQFGNVFLLLGSTLGNSENRSQTLRNVLNSMRGGDALLLGMQLYRIDLRDEIISHYESETFISTAFNCLTIADIRRDDGNTVLSFNPETTDVEVHFICRNELTLEVDAERSITLSPGEDLFIFKSHKFPEEELMALFDLREVSSLMILFDLQRKYALVCIRLPTPPE